MEKKESGERVKEMYGKVTMPACADLKTWVQNLIAPNICFTRGLKR
jgi:hypothetical protein